MLPIVTMKNSHIAGGPESLLSLGLCKEDEQSFRCVSDDDIISFLSRIGSSVIRIFWVAVWTECCKNTSSVL